MAKADNVIAQAIHESLTHSPTYGIVHERSQHYAKPASLLRRAMLEGGPARPAGHVQEGQVSGQQVKVKKGISGGKATGALLTAGVSVLATGLSRKEEQFAMVCGNCSVRWVG